MSILNLSCLFKPDSIALIGKGRQIQTLVARNLMNAGFKGPVMPVDPSHHALEGALTYPDVDSLPLTPELAVITSPLEETPALLGQLGARGTRAAVLVSESRQGPENSERQALHRAILEAAEPYRLRVLGPGSLGICVPAAGLNASLGQEKPLPGHVALITQSNAIAQTALEWGIHHGSGFSHIIGVGDAIDVDFGDILDFLIGDSRVRAILLYLEEIRNPREFMSAARRVARLKPIIALRSAHDLRDDVTDAVYAAAFRRAGILRVDDHHELFNLVETLTAGKPVAGDSLAILSNSRSLSQLTAHGLSQLGGRLAQFSQATQLGLEALVDPTEGSPFNPVDLGDRAESQSYGKALDLLLEDPGVDDILVIKAPSTFSDAAAIADAIVERQSTTRHCLLASFPGPVAGEMARQRTMENGIPTYETPREAVGVFMRMFQHRRNQRLLMETPPSMPEEFKPDVEIARSLIHRALAAQRKQLNELEAMRLLAAYGIPTVDTHIANGPAEAEEIAARLGRTVALKIVSEDIPHKRLVGGLARYLNSPKVVRETAEAMLERVRELAPTARIEGFLIQPIAYRGDAYEMTVGVRPGGAFGPVIYFGQGGTETRVIGDIAYGLQPLNMNLARETMSQTRIYHSLRYSLLRRIDLDALALTLIKVSQMVIDLGEIVELEINPLRASDRGVIALDARVRVAEFSGSPSERLAIRPYPMEMEERLVLPDGRDLLIRPILPEDEPALQAQVRRTSSWDLRLRFFQPIRELPHEVAARMTQIDYNCEMGLVVVGPGRPGEAEIYAAVHLISDPDNDRAEYSLIVDRGLEELEVGLLLMRRIVDYARRRGIREIYGEVLRENEGMLRINKALGFTVTPQPDAPVYVSLKL